MGLFDTQYDRLADKLPGKILHAPNGRTFTIGQAEGYSREENDVPLYRPILEMEPGRTYFPRRRNAILFLIACKGGGCVLIRELRVQDGIISGPGAVSEAVGVDTPNTEGTVVELGNGDLRLKLSGPVSAKKVTPDVTQTKGARPRIGPKTLARLMPTIVKAYLASDRKMGTLQAFLKDLLARCATEGELRRALQQGSS
jgi:hypothetical protein